MKVIEKQIGYLCKDHTQSRKRLIVSLDEKLLLLSYDKNNNTLEVSIYNNAGDLNECKEVEVSVQELYNAKYLYQIFYTIYRVKTNDFEFYLLKQLNASSSLKIRFYPCHDYLDCRKKVEEI